MTIETLRREYQSEVIGGAILAILDRLTRNVVSHYDPKVYGGVASWAEGYEDLLHSFVADVLLEQGQL